MEKNPRSINVESVYTIAEKDANVFNMKVLVTLAALAAVSMILNFLGVFSMQEKVMTFSMTLTLVLLLTPIVLFLVHDKLLAKPNKYAESDWFRYVIISTTFVTIMLICISLSFHATILMAIPPLMAAQYHYSRKTFTIVVIATLCLVPVSIYGSFFFGSFDKNLLKGLNEEQAKVLANRFAAATPKRMLEVFTHYTLPVLLGMTIILVMVFGITSRNQKTLNIQTELSEKIHVELENRNKIQNEVVETLANLIETRDASTG